MRSRINFSAYTIDNFKAGKPALASGGKTIRIYTNVNAENLSATSTDYERVLGTDTFKQVTSTEPVSFKENQFPFQGAAPVNIKGTDNPVVIELVKASGESE